MVDLLTEKERARFQSQDEIERILSAARTIAIVGLSSDTTKDSHVVGSYLQGAGYRVIPVNPNATIILGEEVYPDVASVPFPLDLIDVFRPPREVEAIAAQAIDRKMRGVDSPALWLQFRIIHLAAAERAHAAGLAVVMDKCTKVEHARLRLGRRSPS